MKEGHSLYQPRRHAMMIQPVANYDLGRLYAIRVTAYGDPFASASLGAPIISINTWFVDTFMLLVKSNCSTSIYAEEDKDLANPLIHLSLKDYLECDCLHDPAVREALGASRF